MNTLTHPLIRRCLFLALCFAGVTPPARANIALWIGNPGVTATTNWSDNANWNNVGTGGPGAAQNDAKFGGAGAAGDLSTITSFVDASQAPLSLQFSNASQAGTLQFHHTLIPTGVTLTVGNGALTIGGISADGYRTQVKMSGGGTLLVTNALSIGNNGVGSADTQTLLDLSELSNFVFNAASATIAMGSGNRSAADFKLAAISNSITVGTFNANTLSSSSSASGTLTLGSGVNILNVGTFNAALQRNNCTIQFPGTDGSLRVRGVGGTDNDRATMLLANRSASGSGGTDTANLNLNGHPVDLKLGTLTVGQSSNGGASGNNIGTGNLNFDTGIVDATNINLAVTTGNSFSVANGTINVGTNASLATNGTLIAGAGGITLGNRGNNTGASTATLGINGGNAVVSGNIRKANANSVATLTVTAGKLQLIGATNTIGSTAAPIDNLNLADSSLTLPAVGASPTVAAGILTISGSSDTITVSSVPGTASFPAQYPLIAYAALNGPFDFVLGGLPGTYQGYLSNNVAALSIDLVLTNSLIKADVWNGNVNGNWDVTTLNWLFNGSPASFQQGDFVTFDDSLTGTRNVVLTTNLQPAAIAVNSAGNYTFSGPGSLSGNASLNKSGTGTLTLASAGGDNFTGGVIVNDGTVILDQTNFAVAGGITVNAGTVQIGNNDSLGGVPIGALSINGALVFNRTNTISVPTPISGAGAVTQNGSGTVSLSAPNTYTGPTTVANGTLALTGAGSVSNTSFFIVRNSATFDVSAAAQQTALNALNATNANVTVAVSAGGAAAITASSLSLGGANNILNVTALPAIASYPVTFPVIQSAAPIAGPFNFVLGSMPAASPAYGAFVTNSPDQTTVLLTITNGPVGTRPVVLWTGADIPNLNTNWSDRLNWQLPGAPAPGDSLVFNNTATQPASALSTPGGGSAAFFPDNVNNIVDNDFNVSSLTFTNTGDSYHNTLISGGKSLILTNTLTVGALDSGGAAQHGFVTISGNGSLTVGNSSANLQVWNGSGSVGGSQATLDLSALNSFTATVGRLTVGASAVNNAVNRPSGVIFLARTNSISASFQTTTVESGTTTGNAGIVVADCNGNAGSPSFLWLGQANTISADTIVIGRQKATGHLQFNPIYVETAPYPSVTLQGFSSSQVSVLDIGDGVGNTGTTSLRGDANFNGGFVHANIDTLNIGRASSGGTSGTTIGTMEFDAGTVSVNNLTIGLQPAAITKVGVGTNNVGSNVVIGAAATLNVRGNLSLGLTPPGTASSTTAGTLNITNAIVNANRIVAGTNSASVITLAGGRLTITNNAGTTDTPLGTLELMPLGTPDNSATVLRLTAATTPAIAVVTLNVDGLTTTTNIIDIAAAPPAPGAELPLIQYSTLNLFNGTFNLGLGSLPAGFAGYLTNDTAISAIALVLTNAPRPHPVMTATSVQAGNLVTSGTNGYANGAYYVLSSTNVSLPISSWQPVATNNFDANGNFSFSNPIDPSKPQQFFIMQLP